MGQSEQKGNGSSWNAQSKVLHFAEMPKRRNPNGSESRDVVKGALATGERVRVHETTQAAGTAPNPPHTIEHTELICVREGALDFIHGGKAERAEAGDIIFVAKGTLHTLRNAFEGPTSYFVISIGGDVQG